MIFLLCVQWLPLTFTIGPREAGQLSECSYAKTPIATNDMNFLVFNIKVCMIYVWSLNWANYAFFTRALVHFYQVAAAQDKLVNYNKSYIKTGESPLLIDWVILLTMCCRL